MRGKFLTLADRRQIEFSLKQGYSLCKIAKYLERGSSTLHYEVSTEGGAKNYNAERAQLNKVRNFDRDQLKLPFDPPVDIGYRADICINKSFSKVRFDEIENIIKWVNEEVPFHEIVKRSGRDIKTVRNIIRREFPEKKKAESTQFSAYQLLEKRVSILEMQVQILSESKDL